MVRKERQPQPGVPPGHAFNAFRSAYMGGGESVGSWDFQFLFGNLRGVHCGRDEGVDWGVSVSPLRGKDREQYLPECGLRVLFSTAPQTSLLDHHIKGPIRTHDEKWGCPQV